MSARFQIVPARTAEQISLARDIFMTYASTLEISLAFQNFTHELAQLPGYYAHPIGDIFLAFAGESQNKETLIGCVAIRPLVHTTEIDRNYCEIKRLYVSPQGRLMGLGLALTQKAIETAKELGYSDMFLDTLPSMDAARRLYTKVGFVECEKYYNNPIEGAIFMKKTL